MQLETKRIAFESPELQEMLTAFHRRWGIDPSTYVRPAEWVVKTDGVTIFAAMGFTSAPDFSIVYIADLLCQPSKSGVRAMVELVTEFTEKAYSDKRVQSVCAKAIYQNKPMRKLIERFGLKPLTVVYGVTKDEYERDRIKA